MEKHAMCRCPGTIGVDGLRRMGNSKISRKWGGGQFGGSTLSWWRNAPICPPEGTTAPTWESGQLPEPPALVYLYLGQTGKPRHREERDLFRSPWEPEPELALDPSLLQSLGGWTGLRAWLLCPFRIYSPQWRPSWVRLCWVTSCLIPALSRAPTFLLPRHQHRSLWF